MPRKNTRKTRGQAVIPPFVVGNSLYPWGGLNTATKDNRFLYRGDSHNQLNWVTGQDRDHIELRRGSTILGETKRNIAGAKVKGLGIGIKNTGEAIPFFKFNQKVLFYDQSLNDTVEIGTDILPLSALEDYFNFMPYQNLAGAYVYATSRNSGMYKFSLGNLGSYLNLAVSETIGTATITIASPAVITAASHGLVAGTAVMFTTTGALPSGIYPNTTYIVLASGLTANDFEISRTFNGPVINTFGTQSGVHTLIKLSTAIDYNFNFAKINRGYMFGMNRKGQSPNSNDVTGLYLSTPDSIQNNSTVLNFSVGTGDGVQTTFSGTIALEAPNTAYFVSITDDRELFTDDKNGELVGSLGGTGAINYITGAYSVTFNTAPLNTQVISGTYQQENSTVGGVADFVGTGSDTFRQDDGGGEAVAVWPFNAVEYCFHKLRSWSLTTDLSTTPITFLNQPYFEQIGIPNVLSAFPTGEGVLFLNNALPAQPKFSILRIPPGSTNLTVVPEDLSDALDLSQYGIDEAVVFRWGDWDFLSIKNVVNGSPQSFNGVTFMRNIVSGLWNKINAYINCAADFQGTLIYGSSISANLFELFTGFDDSNTAIDNFHNQAYTDLEIDGLKKVGYIHLVGLIQAGQELDVFISLDNGEYVKVFTIKSTGSYISSQVVAVGTQGIGIGVVGGGYEGETEYALRYEVDIPIHTDMFEYISWGVKATKIGYVSIQEQSWKDIRFKRRRLFPYNDNEINNDVS